MCNIIKNTNALIARASANINRTSINNIVKANIAFNTADIKVDANENIESIADKALKTAGIKASIKSVMAGPVISRIFAELDELTPEQIKLADQAITERTIQMIFGNDKVSISTDPNSKSIVIDVPNKNRAIVPFGNIYNSLDNTKGIIPVALGVDITGDNVAIDLADAPHMLIAGQTGAGKSVCINSIIMSIVGRLNPNLFKLTLVDPKAVELSMYSECEHLAQPIITDPKEAIKALADMCDEMDSRKMLLAKAKVRNIASFNEKVRNGENLNIDPIFYVPMPYHIVVIDEFADLMLTAEKELVNYVSRIAAVGRALGIHLILATQRPSVKVIPGEIKANIPTRIAFKVAQSVDSSTILDETGAEKLLGKGDMILKFKGLDAKRVHGCFISDEEVEQVQCKKNRNTTDCIPFADLFPRTRVDLADDRTRFQIYLAATALVNRLAKEGYDVQRLASISANEIAGLIHTTDIRMAMVIKGWALISSGKVSATDFNYTDYV